MLHTWKSALALLLSLLIPTQSLQAVPFSASASPSAPFNIQIPSALGQITESHLGSGPTSGQTPQVILIQNLHVNRSVQRAISGILKNLKAQNLLPERLAAEGLTGSYDVKAMQSYPDVRARHKAADYLLSQGEMPGELHFVVTEGQGGIYGIETADLYDTTIDMYRRAYEGSRDLQPQLDRLENTISQLSSPKSVIGDPVASNVAILKQDIASIRELTNTQVTPEEIHSIIACSQAAIDHLQKVLPAQTAQSLLSPVSASINFYALALLRDQALYQHAMDLRAHDHQTTTVIIVGGFHTPGITQRLKAQGLSYVVITPEVKELTKTDEKLYIERMLGHHLTVAQVDDGRNRASRLAEPPLAGNFVQLFFTRLQSTRLTRLKERIRTFRPTNLRVPLALTLASFPAAALAQSTEQSSQGGIDMLRTISAIKWPGLSTLEFIAITIGVVIAMRHFQKKNQIAYRRLALAVGKENAKVIQTFAFPNLSEQEYLNIDRLIQALEVALGSLTKPWTTTEEIVGADSRFWGEELTITHDPDGNARVAIKTAIRVLSAFKKDSHVSDLGSNNRTTSGFADLGVLGAVMGLGLAAITLSLSMTVISAVGWGALIAAVFVIVMWISLSIKDASFNSAIDNAWHSVATPLSFGVTIVSRDTDMSGYSKSEGLFKQIALALKNAGLTNDQIVATLKEKIKNVPIITVEGRMRIYAVERDAGVLQDEKDVINFPDPGALGKVLKELTQSHGKQSGFTDIAVLGTVIALSFLGLSMPWWVTSLPVTGWVGVSTAALVVAALIRYSRARSAQNRQDQSFLNSMHEKLSDPALFSAPKRYGKDLFTVWDSLIKPSVKQQVVAMRGKMALASAA